MLNYATREGDLWTMSVSGRLPRFTFRIANYLKHVSVHLVDVEGIEANERHWGLRLRLYGNDVIGMKSLGDVVSASTNFGSNWQTIYWNYLWGSELGGSRGGVALYDGALDGPALDECLASIWVNEALPRPAGQARWTESRVLAWVDQYRNGLNNLNEVLLEANSEQELCHLTDSVAIAYGVKRVYLHCKTWRGEYWPSEYSRVHVNTAVFPAGKTDLKRYADYLAAHNIMLRLHSVSCGIGKSDPDYIVGGVDRRLASWGGRTLEEAVDAGETRLLFRPDPGVEPPIHACSINYYD